MILLLLLFQGFKTVFAPSILFPVTYPTNQYFSSVYNFSLSHTWKVREEFSPGIYGDIFVKNSGVYADPYFQNPDLHLRLFTFGFGGCFDYKINDYFLVGAGLGIYRLGFRYPLVTENGEIVDQSEVRTNLGFYSSFTVSKLIKNNWRLGATMKIYIIGKTEDYYAYFDYYPPYDYYEYYPYFPSPLQGISLGVCLGYER
jgi:hypothetical protein